MISKLFGRGAAALIGVLFVIASQAHAQWTITTYNQIVGNPDITSMAIADQYYNGALPTRFVATGQVATVDLWENGGSGQFIGNLAIPGLDGLGNGGGPGDTNDYTARAFGTLVVASANTYHFFTDSDDGNRFRLDLNQNGTYEDVTESIVPDGGLQGAGNPGDDSTEKSDTLFPGGIALAAGNYKFEVSFFERGGGGSIDAGYTRAASPTRAVVGASGGPGLGISVLGGLVDVRVVGAAVPSGGPDITNFVQADALRTSPNQAGFPQSGIFEVFNTVDSGGDGDFPGGSGLPGLGAPDANDDDDFLAVGRGILVVPAGGITNAVFRSNTDDGGRLLIDVNHDGDLTDAADFVINHDVLQGPTNTDSAPVSLPAGQYAIEYSWFERGGGAEGEVSVRLTDTGPFTLLGDNAAVAAGTGLDVALIPEPTTIVLLALSMFGLIGISRRRQ